MSWIMRDYACQCGEEYEELKVREEDQGHKCPRCGLKNNPCISAPGIATYTLMSKEDKTKHLKKRSEEHSKKLVS